jgi:hypothetical protein
MVLSAIAPTRERLDAVLRAGSGSLLDTPYPLLLLALALRGASGVLTLHRDPLQKEILFDEGSPVDCQSNIATETVGRFLVSLGRISETECHSALAAAASRGLTFEEVLVEQKLLPRTELDRIVQQSLGRKLLEPFSWKRGAWEILFGVPPVDSTLRVKVPQLVLTGILKVEPQEVVDQTVGPAGDRYLALGPDPLCELDELRLTAEQQKIVEAARMGTRLADAAAATAIDLEDFRRVVYALLLLGAVSLTESPVRAAPHFELENPFALESDSLPPVEPPPSRPSQPQPQTPPGVAAASADEVRSAHASLRNKDAFELLGAGESDGPLQFQRAFLAIADRFLPSKFDERAPDGLREKAQDVFLAAARAYAELADPVRRDALRAARAARAAPPAPPALTVPVTPAAASLPPKEQAPAKPQRTTLKAPIIDPEALCRNGRELAEAGKLREALSSFELAAECDAQNGTYAAEVAWCRFLMHVSPAPATLKMLRNAIRIDPRSGLAHLYAGKVAAALGDRREASAFLDRAAMLMPRDLRVVEALKSLR